MPTLASGHSSNQAVIVSISVDARVGHEPKRGLSLAACATQEDANGAWVGTTTTEGNVTTVVNESGSVWGGTATLVEEASIGVESGVLTAGQGEVENLRMRFCYTQLWPGLAQPESDSGTLNGHGAV